MNSLFIRLAMQLPTLISDAVAILHKIQADGADKKKALLDALPDSMVLTELVAGKDIFNDANVMQLVSALVDAEAAVQKARAALKARLLAKAPSA